MTAPLPQRIVPFYGDQLAAVQHEDGAIFVVFNRLCDNLGLNRYGQVQRVKRSEVMKEGFITITVATEGGPQTVQCLRIDLLPLFLTGVQAKKVKEDLQEQLLHYQKEAAQVLWQAFRPQILVDETLLLPSGDQSIQQLKNIADMGRAIVLLAEQQIELQGRMNNAAKFVKSIKGELSDVQVRLGVLEDKLHPAASITDEQAAEVSNVVKALAELLTAKGIGTYQAVFQELYRRYGVSSYKLIRIEQYTSVLSFLEDWRAAAVKE